jgi:hypothetical protein
VGVATCADTSFFPDAGQKYSFAAAEEDTSDPICYRSSWRLVFSVRIMSLLCELENGALMILQLQHCL